MVDYISIIKMRKLLKFFFIEKKRKDKIMYTDKMQNRSNIRFLFRGLRLSSIILMSFSILSIQNKITILIEFEIKFEYKINT